MTQEDATEVYSCYLLGLALRKLWVTSKALGHKSLASTFRYVHYLKDTPDYYKEAFEELKQIFANEQKHHGEKLYED